MDFLETALSCTLAIVAAIHLLLIYKVDLQMMQQNSYRNDRYFRWWRKNSDYSSASRMVGLAVLLLMLSQFHKLYAVIPVSIAAFALESVLLAKKKYKKPLAFTKRVWRLFTTMIVFSLIIAAVAGIPGLPGIADFCYATAVTFAALNVLSWLVLTVCNRAMKPVESAINKMYVNDAKQMLSQMPGLKIIGITGSYGKTSTKHYLNRILSEQFDVLMTPGSFNTPMGVVRTVREMMKPYNEVFIVEMGAKQIGDIKEICDLVHPEIGIVTAVGEQHLESFKNIRNVQRTKFELVDSLPEGGFAVVNDDFEFVANRPVENVPVCRYAISNTDKADYTAKDIEYSEDGTRFTVEGKGRTLELKTKLVGECNISNLMAAVIVAMKLGVTDERIKFAVSKIEQVEHRLNMKCTAGGVTIIDDAFNSNPDGSRMALYVLSRMKKGKRIVVTPGMIELGDKQAFHNSRFGERIAETSDIAIVVGQYNRKAIVEGIRKNGNFDEKNLLIVDSFAEAQAELSRLLNAGDTVLYENDLPDTFK